MQSASNFYTKIYDVNVHELTSKFFFSFNLIINRSYKSDYMFERDENLHFQE